MTDDTNMGTYQDVDKDKRYVAQDALYVPLGGETTKPRELKWLLVKRLQLKFKPYTGRS